MVWAAGWVIGPIASGLVREVFGFDRGFKILFAAMLVLYAGGITYSWLVLRPLEQASEAHLDQNESGP
jgi:hypothetical protein